MHNLAISSINSTILIYKILDIFFLVFHSTLTLFNLFGWISKKTRKLNLITLSLTGFSWLGLGIFYGIGYCPLTDWHFKILEKMGHTGLPASYIKYIADRLTGYNFDPKFINHITAIAFIIAFTFSVILNVKNMLKKRNQKNAENK